MQHSRCADDDRGGERRGKAGSKINGTKRQGVGGNDLERLQSDPSACERGHSGDAILAAGYQMSKVEITRPHWQEQDFRWR